MRLGQANDEPADNAASWRPAAMLIGDWDQVELAEAVATLRIHTDLLAVAGIEQAVRLLTGTSQFGAAGVWPELLVLAQARPGRFSARDVARLKQCYPLVRILGLLGSWCEGETRTGTAWPATQRCFWYQWPARFESELDRIGRGLCPAWGLPETASTDEQLLWTSAESDAASRGEGTILVAARSMATADAVADACCAAGLAAEAVATLTHAGGVGPPDGRTLRPLTAAIWEGTRCEADEAAELAAFCARHGPTPTVVLLDFPRRNNRAMAISAGARGVVAKPFQLEDLVWQVRKAMSKDLQLG